MCVGKIALFGKALVSALARGALAMCAMWVGFPSFFAGGRKKQNKFPSNLHCPVKKLNPFFRYLLSLSYLFARLSSYTCCQRTEIYAVAELRALSCPRTTDVCAENRCSHTTETAIVIYFLLATGFGSVEV